MKTTSMLLLLSLSGPALAETNNLRKPEPRELLSYSTSYCYQNDEFPAPIPCWDSKPVNPPQCTSSGGTGCRCTNTDCVEESGSGASYKVAYCPDKTVYVSGTTEPAQAASEEAICTEMAVVDNWVEAGQVRSGSDAKFGGSGSWWSQFKCWWYPSHAWRNNKCIDKTRYLNEECWDGGDCNNNGIEAYAANRLSCVSGSSGRATCVPALTRPERNQCECGWFELNFFVVCGAANDACNGHPCVLSTGDGNKYCDYNADTSFWGIFSW